MLTISKKGIRRLKRIRERANLKQRLRSEHSRIQRRPHMEQFEPRQLLAADLATPFSAHPESSAHQASQFDFYSPPRAHFIQDGAYFSEASEAEPLAIVDAFLASRSGDLGLSTSDLLDYIVTDRYTSDHNGVTHVYLQQRHLGLPIVEAYVNANVTDDGRLLNVGSSFVPLSANGVGSTAGSAIGAASSAAVRSAVVDRPFASVNESAALTAADALIHLSEQLEWQLSEPPQVVAEELGPANRGQMQVLRSSGISLDVIPAELQYVPQPYGLELAWRLTVRQTDGEHWYDAHVSAETGDLLNLEDWVSHAAYEVFAIPKESPNDGAREQLVDPHDPTASPFGWHDTDGVTGHEHTITRGNNAWAYTDRNGDDVPDAGSSPDGTSSLEFNFDLDFTLQPLDYRDAAVTQLFYLNNTLHDVHYQYGFDEPAGNFQENNYGRGGTGGDPVLAEAQESADSGPFGPLRGNAVFASPPEGTPGRMQMFLFDDTNPERDGSFDSGIVVHEYGHGVSTRLTGGPANAGALSALQSRGMGEGWSDWYTLMFSQVAEDTANDQRGVGTYALGQNTDGPGIRLLRYSYDMAANNNTFSTIIGSPYIHDIGEVWASVLWDLNWALIQGNALDPNLPNAGLGFDPDLYAGSGGNNLALQLVMDGMKLQPVNPSFLDARDAILVADQVLTGGANQLTVWTVFARRGMGFSAQDGGDSNSTFDIIEAFDLPATSDGEVAFLETTVEEGGLLNLLLRDLDLSGNQTLQVTAPNGDVETVELTPELALGVFRGSLDTAAGAVAADGVLQVASGDTVSVSYLDADDGNGATNTTKSATTQVETRFASPLFPQSAEGSLLATSDSLALLRSAADIEPFTFFAEAGERVGVVAQPFDDAILDVQIVGLTSPFQSSAAGSVAVVPITEIPADGQYQVFLGSDMAVAAEVTISRNVVVEQAIGDSADGHEFSINDSALGIAGGTRYAVSARSVPVGPGIINGSFETGDFSGWNVLAIGNTLAPWTISGAGAGSGYGLAPTQPQTGNFVAWNGFDGAGPLDFIMTQEVLLPPTPVALAWKDRIQWDFDFIPGVATEGRTFEVQVRDPEDLTLLGTVYSFDTRPEFINASGDTGWQSREVDLSAFAGQYVQLAFVEHIEQIFTGPGQFEIDDIELVGMPEQAPDVDEFVFDLRGKAGKQIDVLLASDRAALSSSMIELLDRDGATVLATGSANALDANTEIRNYRSGILGFVIPADGTYTVRVTAPEFGDYQVIVTDSVVFDTEPSDTAETGLLRSLDQTSGAMGFVDGVNSYRVVEANYDFVELPFNESSYVFLSDDTVSDARDIEFDFQFYDQTHNSLYVSDNGFLTFLPNQYHGCCFGRPMPNSDSPNAVIAGWWRDLVPFVTMEPLRYIRHKTLGDPGNRVFYLDFFNIPQFSDVNSTVTMQFKLFEANGDIELHYQKAPADGWPHTAGIENHTGTDGLEYYRGFASLPDNLAVRYERASALDRYTLTLEAGQSVTLRTQTPFDAAGHPVPNTLDPELKLIHPDGVTIVGADQNSLDGKNAQLTVVAPVSGTYTLELTATSGVGAYTIEKIVPDQEGPKVTDVILGSSAWTSDFVNVADAGGAAAGNGLGVSIVGSEQLDNLPWVNTDKIYIQFSEDVSAGFNAGNVQLTGINVSDYTSTASFAYGVDGENVGTITLAAPLAGDILFLELSDGLQDSAGNPLDGEWGDGSSLYSGDGTNGGSFRFRFDALQGDVDSSDVITLVDVFAAFAESGKISDEGLVRMDVDGSGQVNLVDVFAIFRLMGASLPSLPAGGSSGVFPAGEGGGLGGGLIPAKRLDRENPTGVVPGLLGAAGKVGFSGLNASATGTNQWNKHPTDGFFANLDYNINSDLSVESDLSLQVDLREGLSDESE